MPPRTEHDQTREAASYALRTTAMRGTRRKGETPRQEGTGAHGTTRDRAQASYVAFINVCGRMQSGNGFCCVWILAHC